MIAEVADQASFEVIDIAEEVLAAGWAMARLDRDKGLLPGEGLAGALRAETMAGSRPALVRDARRA